MKSIEAATIGNKLGTLFLKTSQIVLSGRSDTMGRRAVGG